MNEREIARKFIEIRAIRGVLHGVTGSSEANSLYVYWLKWGHGVKNGRSDSLRSGLTPDTFLMSAPWFPTRI